MRRRRTGPLVQPRRGFAPVDVRSLIAPRAHHRALHLCDGLTRAAARAYGVPRAPALRHHHRIGCARHDAPTRGTGERELEVGLVHAPRHATHIEHDGVPPRAQYGIPRAAPQATAHGVADPGPAPTLPRVGPLRPPSTHTTPPRTGTGCTSIYPPPGRAS